MLSPLFPFLTYENISNPIEIQAFQNNLGLNLHIMHPMSYVITISKESLGRRN